MDAVQQNLYTVEDIYELPEGTRAELIDGMIYMMATPSTRHQEIVFSISRKIADYIDRNKGACRVYISPFAVFLKADDRNYVEPDICVICDPDKITEKGCQGAPDWVIEVVSPSSARMDYMVKLIKYQNAGVREYWTVDPDRDRVIVYDLENEDMHEYTFSDEVRGIIYSGLEIDFSEVV